jgi:diguanylate cyclase (GGDEF)-like protein
MSPVITRMQIENEILSFLGQRHTEETQAAHLLARLMDSYPLLSAAILAVDKNRPPVVFAQRGLSGSFIKELYTKGTLPVIGAALSGEVVLAGGDPRLSEPAWKFEHESPALYAAPCRLQGETIGVFIAEFRETGLADSATREAFGAYAQLSAVFLALRRFHHEISRIPETDSVTGLNSFKFFHEVLHQELSRGERFSQPLSIIVIKIRFLREMNDIYGHAAADKALVDLARAIKGQVRVTDYLSRSGSGIYIVMPETPKKEAAALASRIIDALDAMPSGDTKVTLKTAIGVAAFPEDGRTERMLIPHVESMVHESVRKGGNTVTVFGD